MKYITSFVLLLVFISCDKEIHNAESLQRATPEQSLNSQSRDIEPIPGYTYKWTSLPGALADPPYNVNGQNLVMTASGKVYCLRGFSYDRELYKFNAITKKWAASNDFTFDDFRQYVFSYQSKIYMGFTQALHTIFGGIESIDVNTGTRTAIAIFPGTPVSSFTSFVIGDKVYIMSGRDEFGNTVNQFWEYNFLTNVWTNKGNSPLGKRAAASAFVINNKAYFGCGYDLVSLNGHEIQVYKNDWMQYTPGSIFPIIAKTNFPGAKRAGMTGFVIGSLAFMGFGRGLQGSFKDFWRYSPDFDSWYQTPSWPGRLSSTNVFNGFSVDRTGYIVKGELGEFWNFEIDYL